MQKARFGLQASDWSIAGGGNDDQHLLCLRPHGDLCLLLFAALRWRPRQLTSPLALADSRKSSRFYVSALSTKAKTEERKHDRLPSLPMRLAT